MIDSDIKYQIYYHVLSSDGSDDYVLKRNLFVKWNPVAVNHPEIGKYFRMFNGKYYVPNDELRSEYPDDENAAQDYYKLMDEENCLSLGL